MPHAPTNPRILDVERHTRRARVVKQATDWLYAASNQSIYTPDQWAEQKGWQNPLILRNNDSVMPRLSMFTNLLADNGYVLNNGAQTLASKQEALQGHNQAALGKETHGAINHLLSCNEATQEAFLLMRYRDECLKKAKPVNTESIERINAVLGEMTPGIVKKINDSLPKGRLGEHAIVNIRDGQSLGI